MTAKRFKPMRSPNPALQLPRPSLTLGPRC